MGKAAFSKSICYNVCIGEYGAIWGEDEACATLVLGDWEAVLCDCDVNYSRSSQGSSICNVMRSQWVGYMVIAGGASRAELLVWLCLAR